MLGVVGSDAAPARLVQRLVERREHDGAVRQTRDDAQHLSHDGGAAHHAGDDHGRGRRRLLPCPRLRQHQGLVALHLGDAALALEVRRPVLGDDLQECERRAPVLGVGLGDEASHAGGIDVLDLHGVHQAGKLAREPRRLCRRTGSGRDIGAEITIGAVAAALGLGPRQHQLGECQPALDFPDRRRDLAGARGKVVDTREHGGLLARAYDGPDLGQQERRAACGSQERLLQMPAWRAASAAGWSCRRDRAAPGGRRRERAGRLPAAPPPERSGTAARAAPCRCGAPGGPLSACFVQLGTALRDRSASASASGVPTCIHRPSRRTP